MNLTKLLVYSIILLYISAVSAQAALQYDVNGNGVVEDGDLAIIQQHYNEVTGPPYPAYDVKADGLVDIHDATVVGQNIGEVVTGNISSASNLLANPGFESGTTTPLNWTLVTYNGSTPSWDANVSHTGSRSIRIQVTGTQDNKSGYPKSDLINLLPNTTYNFSAWVMTEGAGGTNAPAVRIVELDADLKWMRQTSIGFSTGSNAWAQKSILINTTSNTSFAFVYANIWNGYGTFWVDDVEVTSARIEISSSDGLKLMLSPQGNVNGIAINDTVMPMLESQGGFSFREVLTSAPNLLANPGFENGTSVPLNWSFVTVNGSKPVWDTDAHSGGRSIKVSVSGTSDNRSGYPYQDMIKVKPLTYYKLSTWVKTIGANGSSAPAVRVVEFDSAKKSIRNINLMVKKGTNDWTQMQVAFITDINTSYLFVYANIYNGYGTLWLDDVSIEPFFGPTIYLNSTIMQNPNGTITQKASANDIDFTFYYIPRGRYIELLGDIQDLRNEDRALQLIYNMPMNASGWRWGDYIRSSRVINGSTYYENVYMSGDTRTQSVYPFASIDNNTHGLGIAVPMDVPRIYRNGYDPSVGYSIQYDFGLSNLTMKIGQGHANFSFLMYKLDEPEWGFRSVVKKYYEIYPGFFEKRVEKEGLWIYGNELYKIPNVNDFGFMFDEGGYMNVSFDDDNDIYSFVYTEPWGWWRDFGENSNKPSYFELISGLYADLNSTNTWKCIPLPEMINAVFNSALIDYQGKYYLNESALWANWYGSNWSQNFPTNPDPDIMMPNRFHISYEHEINDVFENIRNQKKFIDNWTFGDNASWDRTSSHNGNYSAKISIITEKNDTVSGNWIYDTPIVAIPNKNYTFSAWIKTEGAKGIYKPSIRIIEVNKNGTSIIQRSLTANMSDMNWTFNSLNFTSNSSTAIFEIYANIYKGNGTVYFDDINLNKEMSNENLIENNGFENNSRGNKISYELSGVYLDSLGSGKKDDLWRSYKWAEIENYNSAHWKYSDIPLVFSYEVSKPILLQLFSQYEYLNFISNDFHFGKRLIMANILGGYEKYAHKIDILGGEIYDIESDWQSSYRRTLSYHKSNSNLMRGTKRVSPISHEEMEQYIKYEMFYGIYPGIYDSDKENIYFENPTLYERDRDLFKKYIPLIREISNAGWEPIPYSTIDNNNILIERYGSLNNSLYLSLMTDQINPQNGILYIDFTKFNTEISNNSKAIAYDLISGKDYQISIQNKNASIMITMNPKDTIILKIVLI